MEAIQNNLTQNPSNLCDEKTPEIENVVQIDEVKFLTEKEEQQFKQIVNQLCGITNFENFLDFIINNSQFHLEKHLDFLFSFLLKETNLLNNNDTETKLEDNLPIDIIENSIFQLKSQNEENFNLKLNKFCLNFFKLLDNKEKIFQQIVTKPTVNNRVTHIINLFKHYKKENKLKIIISTTEEAVKSILEINMSFLKDFINLFELKETLFSNEAKYLSNIINDLIKNTEKKKIDKIMRIIEFFSKFIKDEQINLSSRFVDLLNINILYEISIEDKSLFNVTKKILRIYPEQVEHLIYHYLDRNETKHASDLAKDKEFSQHIDQSLVKQIISQSTIKAMCYHYSRYWNYEIDIEQLTELYEDKPEVMSYLLNRLIKEKLFYEAYYLLKRFNFNLDKLNLDEFNSKNLKFFLLEYLKTANTKNKNFNKLKSEELNKNFLSKFKEDPEINIYVEDFFGPINKAALKIDLPTNKIIFVDNFKILNKFSHLVKNCDKPYGIDFEWRSQSCSLEQSNGAAIMQIASHKFVFVFDVFKINSDVDLQTLFLSLFKNKTILGFGMKSDICSVTGELKSFLLNSKIIDIQDFYKSKNNKICPGLSSLCQEVLKKELCKGEQMSNWERRPLRMRQLHYAALDAHILIKLYEELSK